MTDKLPWYHKGLPFKCTGCGQCCTGAPGYVWVTDKEIEEMAAYIEISPEDFVKRYVRKAPGGRLALIERPKNYDCVFLKDKKCTIYPVRPKQCQTFPWWKETLSSRKAWDETGSYCEGINHPEAPVISLKEIEKDLNR